MSQPGRDTGEVFGFGAIAEAGRTTPSLSAASLETLASLERDVALEVYVTPT